MTPVPSYRGGRKVGMTAKQKAASEKAKSNKSMARHVRKVMKAHGKPASMIKSATKMIRNRK